MKSHSWLNYVSISIFIASMLIFVFGSGLYTKIAKAAIQSFYPNTCYTASATTSPVYFANTATSTLSCVLGPDGVASATLLVQVNASSTSVVLNFHVEESMDGVDWYPIATPQIASTTNPFSITPNGYLVLGFASSTVGGVVASTGLAGIDGLVTRNHYVIDIPVRMKQVRVYANKASGQNAAVWMQILPRQSIN